MFWVCIHYISSCLIVVKYLNLTNYRKENGISCYHIDLKISCSGIVRSALAITATQHKHQICHACKHFTNFDVTEDLFIKEGERQKYECCNFLCLIPTQYNYLINVKFR